MNFFFKPTVVWLLLSIVFLYLVGLFTIRPEVTSGNGNLGLIFVLLAVIIFLRFAKNLWKSLGTLVLQPRTWKFVSLGSLFVLLLASFLEYRYTLNLIDQLGGTPAQKSSRIYRYSWVNQYTNTLFINVYTFIMLISGVVFLHAILRRNRKNSKKSA